MTSKGKKSKRSLLWLIILLLTFLVGCNNLNTETDTTEIEENIEVIELEPVYLTISAVGDIMMHSPQISAYHNRDNNTYDFTHNYTRIAPYIRQADIAIANLETTFGGPQRGFAGYPMFNSPDELADALVFAGFDVIATANNHTIDTGIKGLIRTVEVLKDRDFSVIGTRRSIEEESYIIKDVKGIRVGLTAYTYETPRFGQYKTLNGIKVPKEAEELIDSFSYENLDEDLLKIEDRINLMKEHGAEIIVFYAHWGNEYQRKPNSYQRYIAEKLASYGVDVIFGSHPHVLQPIEIIEREDSDRKTLVVYSLGNFISNQRYETLNNRYTEDGMIVTVEFKKDLNNDDITINNVLYMPTWVYRYTQNGRLRYEIIPVLEFVDREETSSDFSKEIIRRINNSNLNTMELVDSENPIFNQKPIISRD